MYRSATWYVPSGIGIRMPRSSVTMQAGAGRPLRDCRVKNLTCLGSFAARPAGSPSFTSCAIAWLPRAGCFAYSVRKIKHTRLGTVIAKGTGMTADGSAASIWMRPQRSAVGRPAQWSRAGITKVALQVADADGLEAVSMRRVAAELGTGAASLYRYVETREDLLDLMTDAISAEYELAPPSSNWL